MTLMQAGLVKRKTVGTNALQHSNLYFCKEIYYDFEVDLF